MSRTTPTRRCLSHDQARSPFHLSRDSAREMYSDGQVHGCKKRIIESNRMPWVKGVRIRFLLPTASNLPRHLALHLTTLRNGHGVEGPRQKCRYRAIIERQDSRTCRFSNALAFFPFWGMRASQEKTSRIRLRYATPPRKKKTRARQPRYRAGQIHHLIKNFSSTRQSAIQLGSPSG